MVINLALLEAVGVNPTIAFEAVVEEVVMVKSRVSVPLFEPSMVKKRAPLKRITALLVAKVVEITGVIPNPGFNTIGVKAFIPVYALSAGMVVVSPVYPDWISRIMVPEPVTPFAFK
jgi:hypothetical protein